MMNEHTLSEKIEDIETYVKDIGLKQDKILDLLSGNPMDKTDDGLIGEVKDLRERVVKLEKWKDRMVAILIGVSFGAGWGVSDLLTKLFFKH